MLEETNKFLYQRMQNGRIKKSIYTLELLQKHVKQVGNTLHIRCTWSSKMWKT